MSGCAACSPTNTASGPKISIGSSAASMSRACREGARHTSGPLFPQPHRPGRNPVAAHGARRDRRHHRAAGAEGLFRRQPENSTSLCRMSRVSRKPISRTGMFPPMHVIGVRKDIVERFPASTRRAAERVRGGQAGRGRELHQFAYDTVMLPWLEITAGDRRRWA